MVKRFTSLVLILCCTRLSFSQISERPYNPLEFGKRIMMSACVHHLYYNEKILQKDILNLYIQQHGFPPDTITGNARNAGSGMMYGFLFKYMKRFQRTEIFIRPQVELGLGFNNTYEVSTPDQSVSKDDNKNRGIHFKTIDTVKNNISTNSEFDIGYCNINIHLPFALYSGLRLALWIREKPSTEANNESYYRWSIPVGLIINKPVSNCWSLGCDLTFDFMFSGGELIVGSNENDEYVIDSPGKSFSNHCGYRLEFYADGLLTENLSLGFESYLNFYRFGKNISGYLPINDSGISNINSKIPSEFTTVIAGLNITFAIHKSKN